ncbi:MAG TPA: acetate uptake transporter [Gemmatimonadota bacterium]|nr:acetate uptake transporter [Gemmatimonadota bacterium]HEU4529083.1 acetate uptake transporter [Actinomycetota bacterium]
MEDTPQRRIEIPLAADPAPLGLAAFALTTFLLSAKNAGWTDGGNAWLGFAFAYGGLAQLLAGMWEFRNRNVFGATAFSTYGSFWIGLGIYVFFVEGGSPNALNDLGFILLAFAIFNTYMLIWSSRVNVAVFLVFLTLELTEIVLFLGFFSDSETIVRAGGVIGVVTAAVAWYTSAAGVVNGMAGRQVLKVGGPLWRDRPAPTLGPDVTASAARERVT